MQTVRAVKAFAPASIGNVSVGYDLLGAALAPVDDTRLGDEVAVAPAANYQLQVTGPFAHKLPEDQNSNIVTQAYEYFRQQVFSGQPTAPELAITLYKNLPIGSGLGSSASSIVAALAAINEAYGSPCDDHQLLMMMGALEGKISGSVHYDNVAPAWLGGMTLMVEQGGKIATNLPVIESWYWTVCYSGVSVSTAEARALLPTTLPVATTLKAMRNLSVFVDGLHRKDEALAAKMLIDVIAEPHRKNLLKGFDEVKTRCLQAGAIGFGISGSGPTVFAVTNNLEQAQQVAAVLTSDYIQNESGFTHICKIDQKGTRVGEVDL